MTCGLTEEISRRLRGVSALLQQRIFAADLLDAFLLWPSHSCLRCSGPSSCEAESRFVEGRVDDWPVFLPEVGEEEGLGSATPFTSFPASAAS